MGGSPPPPPPPEPQPREDAKEASMDWRNKAYDQAVVAATRSYTAAATLKALADILDPLTDQQLRAAIDEHYRIVNEYRRAQTIYTTTVRTFTEVDSLIKSAIDKLTSLRILGDTHVNNFDQTVIKYITDNITNLYTKQSEMQRNYAAATSNLSIIKSIYESSPLPTNEKQRIYEEQYSNIATYCQSSSNIYLNVSSSIAEMKFRIEDDSSLTIADRTRPLVDEGAKDAIQQLGDTTQQLLKNYNTNIEAYKKELERASKWYEYYTSKANLVRDKSRVIINPAIFVQLLDLAKSAHMNAVYSALFAMSANVWAYTNRNVVTGT